jgi:hypothetical protein
LSRTRRRAFVITQEYGDPDREMAAALDVAVVGGPTDIVDVDVQGGASIAAKCPPRSKSDLCQLDSGWTSTTWSTRLGA